MSFAEVKDLLGDTKEREFLITMPDGKEAKIAIRPLIIGDLYTIASKSEKLAIKEKSNDEATRQKWQNILQIQHSVINPKLTFEEACNLDAGIHMQILTIIQKVSNTIPND